ncbi:MAG: hypothetical protein COS84_06525, partial [Armatimonadetes bacterium CG07_land_8_20_14_0_80_40_9]
MLYAKPFAKLVEELNKMPGIGPKSAQRLALYILRLPEEEAERIREAIKVVKEKMTYCSVCFNITDNNLCSVCEDERRDHSLVCVVEEARDIYQHLHYGGQPGLGQGLPEAQAAFQCYYNKGYSGDLPGYPTGRPVSNPAGIDLADGTFWDSLEMTDNNWISVKYLWVEQSLPLVDWPFIQRD